MGVGERVVVFVTDDVLETDAPDENVIVGVGEFVAENDSVDAGDGVCVGVKVTELDCVCVTVPVGVTVVDGVFVTVAEFDGVNVCVIVFEREGVQDGVNVREPVPDRVLVKESVGDGDVERVTEGVPDADAPNVTELVGVAVFDGEKLGVVVCVAETDGVDEHDGALTRLKVVHSEGHGPEQEREKKRGELGVISSRERGATVAVEAHRAAEHSTPVGSSNWVGSRLAANTR